MGLFKTGHGRLNGKTEGGEGFETRLVVILFDLDPSK